jgi:hypothetical protein
MRDRTTESAPKQSEVARKTKEPAAPAPTPTSAPTIFDLQRTAGNAAVVSLLTEEPVQLKGLQVGAVHDPAEAEADRIADQVMRNLEAGDIARREDQTVRRVMTDGQIYQATLEEIEDEVEEEADRDAAQQGQSAQQAGTAGDEADEVEADESPAPQNADAGAGAAAAATASGPANANPNAAAPANAGAAANANVGAASSASGGNAAAAATQQPEQQQNAVNRMIRRIVRRSADPDDPSRAPGHGIDGGAVEQGVADRIESARGGGRPMDAETLSRMEDGFGADFSGVRIHEGSQAQELNRSLNAQAFTTGSDIFVGRGGMDDHVLAHELAHTVQQGGSSVRRFMAVSDFEALTYESRTAMKSTAQKEIIKMLTAYKAVGTMTGTPKQFTVAPDKIDTAIELVTNMKRAARAYIDAKNTGPAKDRKARRLAGFVSFETQCTQELTKLNTLKANTTATQAPVVVDSSGLVRLEQHYKGSLSGAMEKAALVVEQLAGNNGDSGEFVLDMEIPVSPGVFVGAHFKFEAKRDGPVQGTPGNVEVGCELGFTVGGNAVFAKIQAGLGGYFKASGRDARAAMKLVSYGLYRRCRESSVIPAGVGNKMWGGSNDDQGRRRAEEWSLNVEREELNDDSGSFVETGGYVSVGAEGDVGIGSVGGEVKGTMGTRTDAMSLRGSAKGGAGERNTMGDNWFAQETTGRAVSSIELSAKTTLVEAFGADLKLVFNFSSGGPSSPTTFQGLELEVRARGTLPGGAFSEKLSSLLLSFVTNVKKLQSGQLQKASTLSQVGAGATTAWGIADTTVTGVEGVPTKDLLKSLVTTGGTGAARSGVTSGGGLVDSASRVGLELCYNLNIDGMDSTATFDIRHISQLSAKIPGLIQGELVRRKRLVGGKNVNDAGWGWVY